MWLWTTGSVIYLLIAFVLIIKGIQPLPYIEMDRIGMILYYVSYPLRVLGIFFAGLIFSSITSPVEFLKWGEFGLKITLAYRAFEYSVNAFDANREALILQNQWPDFTKGERGKFYRPDMKLNIPIYLDEEAAAFVEKIASKKGIDRSSVVNEILKSDKKLAEAME